MIAADPGRSQRSLARELGVVGSRVVVLIDLLEGKGLVERRNNPRDRRLHALHLTDQGQHVLDKVRSLRAAHEDDICAALDTTQRAQLNRLLRAIADQQGLSPGVHPGYRERSR
jgi:DNA-binding MarR family transcriptional regulator